MKVLLTHELFLPDHPIGGELAVYEIAKRLKERGIEITVLTTGNPRIKKFDGIPTIRIPIHRYMMNFAVPFILKYARRYDLIQTNNYNACFPSWIAAKLLKKPVVCIVHGMYGNGWIEMRGKFFGIISKIVEKVQISPSYDKVIFLSEYARKEGIKQGVKPEKSEVINPGLIKKINYRKTKKEPFVLFVGRIAKQKGIDYLISAAKRLPEIKFVVVGKGEEEKRIKNISPKNVEFLGFVSDEELAELYSKALIFCLPSVGEGFGFVLLEAMASGCAIVSTVPLDFCGIHIKFGDVKELASSIKYLIENQKKAEKMGRMNIEKTKPYDWDKFIDRLIEIYEEVL
ncbi:MAG: glycosyltransferase family 4 protein [Candidatus Aenigmatarchaeota archaeon]